MLFPDYGSQFVGMGKELYDHSRLIQEYFEEAFNCLNINFVKLCFASSDSELSKIENGYVAIFLISVATAALLKQENINPVEVAGYGIGELSAVSVAGGLSFPDGLYFLHKYAQFYQELLSNLSAAIILVERLSRETIESLCATLRINHAEICIAAYDTPTQFVITGFPESIMHCKELVMSCGGKVTDLPVEKGLHSALMDSVVDQLVKYLEKIDFTTTVVPLISSLEAQPLTDNNQIKNSIVEQLKSRIVWSNVVEKCKEWDLIIEIGPGTTLSKIITQAYPEKLFYSINKLSDIEDLHTAISNFKIK